MLRKISHFFTKKSELGKTCSQSSKRESEAPLTNHLSSENLDKDRTKEIVKSEAKQELLVILPQRKISKFPVPFKIEENDAKVAKFRCQMCDKKYSNKYRLKYHIRSTHMDMKQADGKIQYFTCDLDGKKYKIREEIARHMKSHLSKVKCDFCFKRVSVRYLKDHIKYSHTGIKQPKKKSRPKTKSVECPICFKKFDEKYNLNVHIGVHNKTLKCKFCEKLFGSRVSLKTHTRIYHENPELHFCKICDKKFNQQSLLKAHMKIHDPSRSKDLKCPQCDFKTYDKRSIKYHLNSHKRKNDEIAAMENPHKCPQCSSVLRSKRALDKHIKSVHPKVLLECDICGRRIKNKRDLLSHFRGLHKIRP